MTRKAKDLSPDQRMAIESLLGCSIAENEEIIIRTTTAPPAPEWLQASWKSVEDRGLDRLSVFESHPKENRRAGGWPTSTALASTIG
jgi:hypothetical protein